jgi:hypothetical protein
MRDRATVLRFDTNKEIIDDDTFDEYEMTLICMQMAFIAVVTTVVERLKVALAALTIAQRMIDIVL